jgi:hypothetical protein
LCLRQQQQQFCSIQGDHWLAHQESSCNIGERKSEDMSDIEFSTEIFPLLSLSLSTLHVTVHPPFTCLFATLATNNELLCEWTVTSTQTHTPTHTQTYTVCVCVCDGQGVFNQTVAKRKRENCSTS